MDSDILGEGAAHAEPLTVDSAPDARWPEGWYMMPALCCGVAVWGLAIYSLFHLLHWSIRL